MSIDSSNEPDAFREFEHRGWEDISAKYEEFFAGLTAQCVEDTLDEAGVCDEIEILDLCTGPGQLAAAGIAREASVTGLDFSTAQINIARRNVPGAKFDVGDAQDLPYEDDSFDAVVCGFGIIHLPDPMSALSEMHRVLKPGGRMATSVWATPGPENGFGLIFGAIKAHGDMNVPLPHGPDFFQFSDPGSMLAGLEEAGFAGVATRISPQFWRLEQASDIARYMAEGSVRAKGLIDAQSEAVREKIFAAIAEGVARFRTADNSFQVPMPALIGSGQKP